MIVADIDFPRSASLGPPITFTNPGYIRFGSGRRTDPAVDNVVDKVLPLRPRQYGHS